VFFKRLFLFTVKAFHSYNGRAAQGSWPENPSPHGLPLVFFLWNLLNVEVDIWISLPVSFVKT